MVPSARTPQRRPRSRDDEEGTVMQHLDETDEAPTRIVKLIGDLCGILIYTGIVGLLLYAVLR
jgi:hypothetical protein